MKGRRIYEQGGVVANTILQQLGGAGRLRMMTGAYNFLDLKNGVSFRLKNQRANYVKIMLNGKDLYDVEVGRVRGDSYKVVAEEKDLYNDQLKRFIEKSTGMYLSLEHGGDVDDDESKPKLNYKIDRDEMSIEVDEPTMNLIVEEGIMSKKEARKIKNGYIFWYDQLNKSTREELEDFLDEELEDDDYDDDDDDEFADGGKVRYSKEGDRADFKNYKGAIGSFAWQYDKKINEGILYPLSEGDKEFYSHLTFKKGQNLYRYKTQRMKSKSLILINIDKALIYFLKDSDDDKNPVFESKGIQAKYILLSEKEKYAKGGKIKKKRVRFVDKVESIADRLEGTKVPKRLKKDYGGRYNREEAEEAGRRIAGAQLRDSEKKSDGGSVDEYRYEREGIEHETLEYEYEQLTSKKVPAWFVKMPLESKKTVIKNMKREAARISVDKDLLKEDDKVWNEEGNKLIVDRVGDNEYFLSGFGYRKPRPFSKKQVHEYLEKGTWTLKPKG